MIFDFLRLSIIKDLDLKIGPNNLPIKEPKFDEALYPIILNDGIINFQDDSIHFIKIFNFILRDILGIQPALLREL